MYARGVKSVVRCWYRMRASFMGQIIGVLELERHECGALWSAELFSADFFRRHLEIDWLDWQSTSKRPCSCRSSSRTRSILPTRIGEPAERHLRARFMGREFMFKTLTWPQKSVSQFGMPVAVQIFAAPLPPARNS